MGRESETTMPTRNFPRAALLALFVLCSGAFAQAAPTLQDLQSLKDQLEHTETNAQQLTESIASNQLQIKALADKRRFLQRKTQAERDLIAQNEKAQKLSVSLSGEIASLKARLRRDVTEYLAQTDRPYGELFSAIQRLSPVADQGESAVRQLKVAQSQLSSAKFSSGLNATTSVLNSINDTKPSVLDAISQLAAQAAAETALKSGKTALDAAILFNSQLSALAQGNDSTLLAGDWNGAVSRGLLYTLATGRNPLESNSFNFSTSLFQLSNLSAVKTKVDFALKEITPVAAQLSQELLQLRAKATEAEDAFIQGL